jgi:hypothetical protein
MARGSCKVKGLGPLACKTDKIDACVLAELSRRECPCAGSARVGRVRRRDPRDRDERTRLTPGRVGRPGPTGGPAGGPRMPAVAAPVSRARVVFGGSRR